MLGKPQLWVAASLFAALSASGASAQTPPPAPAPAAPSGEPARPLGDPNGWIGLEDYPATAWDARQEGAVRVRLSVAPLGFVDGCTVLESSGSEALDSGTCRLLMARAFFTPARDAAGQAVPGQYIRRIRWQHPELHPASATPETVPPPASPPR